MESETVHTIKKYTQKEWGTYLNSIEHERRYSKESVDELRECMRSFESEHGQLLEKCLGAYRNAISQDFFTHNYYLVESGEIIKTLCKCKVMVITANPIEKAILHSEVVGHSNNKIERIVYKNTVYFVFKWGKYWIAHVHQGETGANKDLGASATIFEALQLFTPNIIVSLGVAFGIDYKSQNIGDVIVSRRILPYSDNKLDMDNLKPDRSQDKTIDKWLHVRLVNANGFIDSVTYGDILTGGSVLSSLTEKHKICAGYTKADYIIGGEMEGNALFQFANSDGIPGVVIKGICDWGVAKNNIFPDDDQKEEMFKDSLQAYAMTCAVEKASLLFADPQLFSSPKFIDISEFWISYSINYWSLVGLVMIEIVRCILQLAASKSWVGEVSLLYDSISNPLIWIILPIVIVLVLVTDYRRRKKIRNTIIGKQTENKLWSRAIYRKKKSTME